MITFREGLERKSIDQSNPWIGYFFYSTTTTTTTNNQQSSKDQQLHPKNNPYLGFFKHSITSLGFKQLLLSDNDKGPFLSQGLLYKEKKIAERHASSNSLLLIPESIFSTTSSDPICLDNHPSCPICLEQFSDGDILRTLNCSHVFHKDCIDIWLLGSLSAIISTKACPFCKSNPFLSIDEIKKETDSYDDDDNDSNFSMQSELCALRLSLDVNYNEDLNVYTIDNNDDDDDDILELSSKDSGDQSLSWILVSAADDKN